MNSVFAKFKLNLCVLTKWG